MTKNLDFPPAYPHDPRVQSGEAKIADPEMQLQASKQRAALFLKDPSCPCAIVQYVERLEDKIRRLESDKGWESSARHAERSGGTL